MAIANFSRGQGIHSPYLAKLLPLIWRSGDLATRDRLPISQFTSYTLEQNGVAKMNRYTKLENLLKAQDFKEADLETNRVIVEVANREREGYLRE
ncbi:hypothetical protein ASL19_03920 [Cylindrospermopsis sp. CR12]|nr:hypothetical protein ASL19_03920 [Cylindrospermopsis sp. CR12]